MYLSTVVDNRGACLIRVTSTSQPDLYDAFGIMTVNEFGKLSDTDGHSLRHD